MDVKLVEGELKKLFARYRDILKTDDSSSRGVVPECTDIPHLIKMCDYVLVNISTMDLMKVNRWLGYIQGVMSSIGLISVKEEREFTRPIFNPDGKLPIVDIKGED